MSQTRNKKQGKQHMENDHTYLCCCNEPEDTTVTCHNCNSKYCGNCEEWRCPQCQEHLQDEKDIATDSLKCEIFFNDHEASEIAIAFNNKAGRQDIADFVQGFIEDTIVYKARIELTIVDKHC